MLDLATLASLGETAMTHDVEIQMTAANLPNTFVPGRNLLFLTFSAALAYRRGLRHIVTGVCETDYSGYPDCRDDTLKALQVALNLGMEKRFVLHTPLCGSTKPRLGASLRISAVRLWSSLWRNGPTPATRATEAIVMPGGMAVANARPVICGLVAGRFTQHSAPSERLRKLLMFSLIFSRRYSMAHRLLSGGSPKCAVPHGHNETVTVK